MRLRQNATDFIMTNADFYDLWDSYWQPEMVVAYETGNWTEEFVEVIKGFYGSDYKDLDEDVMEDFFALYDTLVRDGELI